MSGFKVGGSINGIKERKEGWKEERIKREGGCMENKTDGRTND